MPKASLLFLAAMLVVNIQHSGALLTDPSFLTKSIQQNNPFAACPGNPQTNMLTVDISLQGHVNLTGMDSSAITVRGLSGAVVHGQSIPVEQSFTCPSGDIGVYAGTKCFWVLNKEMSWDEAEAECVQSGGHLASFRDRVEEHTAILVTRDGPRPDPQRPVWFQQVWMGLLKTAGSESWTWSDGLQSAYRNWQQGTPQVATSSRGCAVFRMGTWGSADCSTRLPAMCSRSMDSPSRLFCYDSTPGHAAWSGGSLVLELCRNASIKSGEKVTFAFNVSNPPHAQASPDVSIAVSGSLSIPPVPMDKPGASGNAAGIPGAADPLLILDRCSPCPEGSFIDGVRGCRPCDPGTWSAATGASACTACPAGSNSSAGSSRLSDCVCARGHMADSGRTCVFCDREQTLTGVAGEVSDGSGADDYFGGTVCSWTIVANLSSPTRIALEFDLLDVVQYADWVLVSACTDPACTSPKSLAQLTGPLVPGGGGPPRRLLQLGPRLPPPHPLPPQPGPPSPGPGAPLGRLESPAGILRVEFRSELPSSATRDARRRGFSARWFVPGPSFASKAVFRLDAAQPCSGRRASEERGRGGGAGLRAPSTAVLVLKLALDVPASFGFPGVISVTGLASAGSMLSPQPAVRVDFPAEEDACAAVPGSTRVGHKCFFGLVATKNQASQPATWEEAEQLCMQSPIGGHLASVASAAEDEAVYWVLRSGGYQGFAWIGFHLDAASAKFAWTDGSGVAYTNWYPADGTPEFPEAGGCASVWSRPWQDPRWHRTPCSQPLPYVICSQQLPGAASGGSLFCSSAGRRGVGEWDASAAGGTLRLSLCPGQSIPSGQTFLVAANVTYQAARGTAPSINVSASGPVAVPSAAMDKLQAVNGCYACLPGQYRRFGGSCRNPCRADRMLAPDLLLVYCEDCPAGAQTTGQGPDAQRSAESCVCPAGRTPDPSTPGQCALCPAGFLCPKGQPVARCPGNTTTLVAGQSDPGQCTCEAGYTRGSQRNPRAPPRDTCELCPPGWACAPGAPMQPCPAPGTSPPGATSTWDCEFCEAVTVLRNASGTVTASMPVATRNQSCAWILRPPRASRVVVTVDAMQVRSLDGGDPSGGMFMDVNECLDGLCRQTRHIRRVNQVIPSPQLSAVQLNSSTGVLQLVFGHVASVVVNPWIPQPYPQLSRASGMFSASWFAEPSLAEKTLSQSNPFASCPHNSSLLQTNVLMLQLSIRSSVPLSRGSAITISGLRGAVKPSGGVSVEVARWVDACADRSGVRAAGSDTCFRPVLDRGLLSMPEARQQCELWGGELACLGSDSEGALLVQQVWQGSRARVPVAGAWVKVGGGCFAKWPRGVQPAGTVNVDYCAALGPDGFLRAMNCAAGLPWICSQRLPAEQVVETPFCLGSRVGWGAWDSSGSDNALTLTICGEGAIVGYQKYVIAFTVLNPSADQRSPQMSLAVSGAFEIPQTLLDTPEAGRAGPGSTQPLEIVGGSADAVCRFPEDGTGEAKGGKHHAGLGTPWVVFLVCLGLMLGAVVALRFTPAQKLVAEAADKMGITLPEWEWPEIRLPALDVRWPDSLRMRLPQLRATWYRRFTSTAPEDKEFETISES